MHDVPGNDLHLGFFLHGLAWIIMLVKMRIELAGLTKVIKMMAKVIKMITKVIQIAVSEKPTGSLMFGAGYSSVSGFVGSIYIKEDNLLGKGQRVATQFSLGGDQSLVNIQFTEPSFLSTRPVASTLGSWVRPRVVDNSSNAAVRTSRLLYTHTLLNASSYGI